MDFVRYESGRIAEHWNVVDVAGLQAQLMPAGAS
jgi:predicted ester cyclase